MQNTSQKLYDLLSTKDYTVKTLNSQGKEETNMDEVEMFSFDFEINGKNFGTVVILLNSDDNMEIFYGDNIGKTMDSKSKKEWTDLLYQLRLFAKRNMMGFKLENINRLKYSMQSMANVNESFQTIFEGYYGTSKTSYNPQGKAKIIIKHTKPIGEEDKRYRNISKIYIENDEGERFKLPFKKLAGAKAMARHVTEGGNPYDIFGQHIAEMVDNINTLSGFVRRSRMFEDGEETSQIVETGRRHYDEMRKNLKKLASKRGYRTYKESWEPAEITEADVDVDHIRKLFTKEAINQKVESALPLLAKLTEKEQEPQDPLASEFEEWADNLVNGSIALTENEFTDYVKKLNDFFAEIDTFGVDGLNVTETLYDIIPDDKLMSKIEHAAQEDPDGDPRPLVYNWLMNNEPEVITQINYDPGNQIQEEKDLDTDENCPSHDDDGNLTNKGKGMSTFDDYKHIEETEKDTPTKINESVQVQDPSIPEEDYDFDSLIKRTNYLLQH